MVPAGRPARPSLSAFSPHSPLAVCQPWLWAEPGSSWVPGALTPLNYPSGSRRTRLTHPPSRLCRERARRARWGRLGGFTERRQFLPRCHSGRPVLGHREKSWLWSCPRRLCQPLLRAHLHRCQLSRRIRPAPRRGRTGGFVFQVNNNQGERNSLSEAKGTFRPSSCAVQRGALPGHRRWSSFQLRHGDPRGAQQKGPGCFQSVVTGWESRAGLFRSQNKKRINPHKVSGLGVCCRSELGFCCPKMLRRISRQAVTDAAQDTGTDDCPSTRSRTAQRWGFRPLSLSPVADAQCAISSRVPPCLLLNFPTLKSGTTNPPSERH